MLRAVDVHRCFGERRAVSGVSFELSAGELMALLGPNGAGKTTLVQMLVGLDPPHAGTVEAPAHVGYAPQSLCVWPDLTPLEQLEFLGQMHGMRRSVARHRGLHLLHELGLLERAHDTARMLSGGMQRRLNLALACVDEPSLLVLDEPTVGLDPHSRALVHAFLRERVASNTAVLLSTHDLHEAESLAHRVAVMNAGELIALAPPGELTDGAHDIEQVFVSLTERSPSCG